MIISKDLKGISDYYSPESYWLLVHNGSDVIMLSETKGQITTPMTLFVGTEAECQAEILRLGLTPKADDEYPSL